MPNTPGSTNEREEIAGMGAPSCIGDPARTAAARRRERSAKEQEIPTSPIAHIKPVTRTMPRTMTGGRGFTAGSADVSGAATMETANGWLNSSMTMEKFDDGDTVAVDQ